MPVPEISPAALARRLAGAPEQHPVLLDVRFAQEHELVALPGSVLLPLPELEERKDELEPLRERELVVYCHHGVRSFQAAAYLQSLGFSAVNLSGGIHRYSLEVDPQLPRY